MIKLTDAQRRLMLLLARGYNTVEIQRRLNVSERTVENRIMEIKNRLEAGYSPPLHSLRGRLVYLCLAEGVINLKEIMLLGED